MRRAVSLLGIIATETRPRKQKKIAEKPLPNPAPSFVHDAQITAESSTGSDR